MREVTKDIETLEEKHYIKEEMPKETYARFRVKYNKEFDKIRKELATCGIFISNLKEMINEAVILGRNLRQLWQDGGIARYTGDLVLIKKGLSSLFESKSLSAERVLQISNLETLNVGEISCFKNFDLKFNTESFKDQELQEGFLRNLLVVDNFLIYLESQEFLNDLLKVNRLINKPITLK